MTLVRYEPWSMLDQLRKEMDRVFETRLPEEEGQSISDWVPAVDIKEEDSRFLIHADVPGVNPEDIEVNMENGVLTIKGQKETEKKEEQEGYKRIERSYGTFFRRFTLPDTADAEGIEARSKNGVLEIVIPKQAKVQPKKIAVKH